MASLRSSSRLLREGDDDATSVDRQRGDVGISEAVGVVKTVSQESWKRLHAVVQSARLSHDNVSFSMSNARRQRSREMVANTHRRRSFCYLMQISWRDTVSTKNSEQTKDLLDPKRCNGCTRYKEA